MESVNGIVSRFAPYPQVYSTVLPKSFTRGEVATAPPRLGGSGQLVRTEWKVKIQSASHEY